MNSQTIFYKTAELVRDDMGCYYFICLQCGIDFENLNDTIEHIEKYFHEPITNDMNHSTDSTPMTTSESDWSMNEVDIDAVVTNIKKESFEEYEEYKFAIPEISHDVSEEVEDNVTVYCPLCATTLSEVSLESHLISEHNRSRTQARIFECEICGKNSFTRSHDLERHKLIHSRRRGICVREKIKPKTNGDVIARSDLYKILSVSDVISSIKKPVSSTLSTPNVTSINAPAPARIVNLEVKPQKTEEKTLAGPLGDELFANRPVQVKPVNYCPICRKACSKDQTLETHLIEVHRRLKKYAKLYECTVCGKNTFTRPYDLRRHELTHSIKNENDRRGYQPAKPVKVEPNIQNTANSSPAKLTEPLGVKIERTSPTTAAPIPAKDPQVNKVLCAVCNMKFDTYIDVTMHLKFAHNEKRTYKCSYPKCNAGAFSTSFLLHRHEISHSIHYRNSMSNHLNRMSCLFCRKSFNKKYNLLQHEKRHLVEMSKRC